MEKIIIKNEYQIEYLSNWSIRLLKYLWNEKEISIPKDINWESIKEIWEYCFLNKNLSSCNIPNTIKKIYWGAFNWNKFSLDKAIIYQRNEDWTNNKEILVSYAWDQKEIILPDHIKVLEEKSLSKINVEKIEFWVNSNIKIIEQWAFMDTKLLKELILPKNIINIHHWDINLLNPFYWSWINKIIIKEMFSEKIIIIGEELKESFLDWDNNTFLLIKDNYNYFFWKNIKNSNKIKEENININNLEIKEEIDNNVIEKKEKKEEQIPEYLKYEKNLDIKQEEINKVFPKKDAIKNNTNNIDNSNKNNPYIKNSNWELLLDINGLPIENILVMKDEYKELIQKKIENKNNFKSLQWKKINKKLQWEDLFWFIFDKDSIINIIILTVLWFMILDWFWFFGVVIIILVIFFLFINYIAIRLQTYQIISNWIIYDWEVVDINKSNKKTMVEYSISYTFIDKNNKIIKLSETYKDNINSKSKFIVWEKIHLISLIHDSYNTKIVKNIPYANNIDFYYQ